MKFITWCVGTLCLSIFSIPALSDAFDIQLTPKQIKEANEYGMKYKGKDIFYSDIVKEACFGKYPDDEGGLVMSKYINIAVISAMMAMKEKTLTPENIKEIETSATFDVVVSISDEGIQSPEDVQIMLIQGTNNILPEKTEFGMKRKDSKIQSIVGNFLYDRVNPRASTTIIVKTRKEQKKYKIDFSDIK